MSATVWRGRLTSLFKELGTSLEPVAGAWGASSATRGRAAFRSALRVHQRTSPAPRRIAVTEAPESAVQRARHPYGVTAPGAPVPMPPGAHEGRQLPRGPPKSSPPMYIDHVIKGGGTITVAVARWRKSRLARPRFPSYVDRRCRRRAAPASGRRCSTSSDRSGISECAAREGAKKMTVAANRSEGSTGVDADVAAAREGRNRAVLGRSRSGWFVMADV